MDGSKKYKVGMYGGKFCPMHLGHRYVLQKAMTECEEVHIIMFYNTPDEMKFWGKWFINPYFRLSQICRSFRDIRIIGECTCYAHFINAKKYIVNGKEDWYAEADRIKNEIGTINAVYSSEPSYDSFFKEVYPYAEHVIVDAERKKYPVHSSYLRGLDDTSEELLRWLA